MIIALSSLSGALGGLISALIRLKGVSGGLSRHTRDQLEQEADIASLNERVNKLFKQRAADASIEARQSKGSLSDEAQARLDDNPPVAASSPRTVPLQFLRR